jgi:Type IV secretion-system coupling protein DNA-binding domain
MDRLSGCAAVASWWIRWPLSTLGALFLAAGTGIVAWTYLKAEVWTPLQRYYWDEYLNTEMFQGPKGDYSLLEIVDGRGHHRIAFDSDVVPATRHGRQLIPFTLSTQARQSGSGELVVDTVHYGSTQMHQVLAQRIYDGRSVMELSWPAVAAGLGVFVLYIVLSVKRGKGQRITSEDGRRLKGPQIVTVKEFNQWSRGDGIGFLTTDRNEIFRIPSSFESSHIMIMGDSGTGKSILQRQVLLQIADRNETAIVYDPALEYTPQFYQPDRGDVILNPLDARCPYWSPSDEVVHEAEALTLATSLFPNKPRENTFFVEGPRKIFAHLLTLRPTPDELVWWMSHEDDLDSKLKGTELATFIYRGAGPQRGGVLGALNMVADSLKMLPRESETKQRWTTVEWSQRQSGWIFVTSLPRFRERLLPLTSLWLDTLVLRLMKQGDASTRRAWFVLDELASLQRLPQLHTALTENRKSNNPVVIGFQGRSQLEVRYGHEAEAMLSQPATKIFLHTSEPHAAKWISDTIGEVEIERPKESVNKEQFPHMRGSRTYYTERRTEPLMLPSEISGMSRLHAVTKVDNFVIRFSFPYIGPLKIQPDFIPRESTLQAKAEVVDIGKRPRQPDVTAVQELKPEKVKKIAAGQEPFFE